MTTIGSASKGCVHALLASREGMARTSDERRALPGQAAECRNDREAAAVDASAESSTDSLLLFDLSSDAADPRAGCCSAQRKQLSRPACRPCGAASRGGGLLLTEQKQSLADSRLTSVD
jgi:hypothetical protein